MLSKKSIISKISLDEKLFEEMHSDISRLVEKQIKSTNTLIGLKKTINSIHSHYSKELNTTNQTLEELTRIIALNDFTKTDSKSKEITNSFLIQYLGNRLKSLDPNEIKNFMKEIIEKFPENQQALYYSNYNITKKMDYYKHDIFLRFTSEATRIRLNSVKKEPFTVEWIESRMKPGDSFFDIGANVGAYSLIAAKNFQGKVKVYSIEPSFNTFMDLCYNIILNDCHSIIYPITNPASAKTGLSYFHYNSLESGTSQHTLKEMGERIGNQYIDR